MKLDNSSLVNDWSWVIHHLITLAIIAAMTLGGVYLVESLIAKHDSARATQDQAILNATKAQTDLLRNQLESSENQWHQVEMQLLAQNEHLTETIAARIKVSAAQVKNDATLSAQDAATRLSQQTKANPGEVVAMGDTVSIDLPITRNIVADLDILPVVQANLSDTQTQLTNETQIATNNAANVESAKKVIASQAKQLTDADTACKAQIKAVKAQARKRDWKYFLFGGAVVEGIRIYFTHSL